MFGIGPLEIIVVALFALIFVGPKRLPEVAHQFGKFFVKIRRMTSEVRNTIDDAIKDAEHELMLEDRKKLQALLEDQQHRAESAAKELMDLTGSESAPESEPPPPVADEPAHADKPSPKWD